MSRDHPLRAPGLIDPSAAPTPMDVLGVPHVFTQTRLLDAPSFCKASKKRGLRIEIRELESLHRRRLLVPLLWVHARTVEPTTTDRPTDASWFTHPDVFAAHRDGRLRDPDGRRYRPWPNDLRRVGPRYSHFQLLGLRVLVAHLGTSEGRPASRKAAEWRAFRVDQARTSLASTRALALVLEALAPRHLPYVAGSLRGPGGEAFSELQAHVSRAKDPPTDGLLERLKVEDLMRQAETLLSTADGFDPMGDFARVVRIAAPPTHVRLRFDALQAHEHRVAAELLLRHLEGRAATTGTEHEPEIALTLDRVRGKRLEVDPEQRAETVMDFRLSDRPAICIAVEGPSEALLLRRTLELYGFDYRSSWVSIVDRKGGDKDVALLARAVAVPRVIADDRDHDALLIQSPLTALLIVNDPEKRYATAEDRGSVLEDVRASVLASFPPAEGRLIDPSELDHLLHVEVWDEEFEFAHFSDAELAEGITQLVDPPMRRSELEEALRRCRSARSNIENIWKKWRPHQPSKVRLADTLWPVLESHILDPASERRVPLRDVVEQALDIAGEVRTANIVRTRTN